jgi:hypothetical protein
MSENTLYLIERFIQQAIVYKNTKMRIYSKNEIQVMAGKGGVHTCFINNVINKFPNTKILRDVNTLKIQDYNKLFICNIYCKIRIRAMAVMYLIFLCLSTFLVFPTMKKRSPNIYINALPNNRIKSTSIQEFLAQKRFENIVNLQSDYVLVENRRINLYSKGNSIKLTYYIPFYIFRKFLNFGEKFKTIKSILEKYLPFLTNKYDDDFNICFTKLINDNQIWLRFKREKKFKFMTSQSCLRTLPIQMYKKTKTSCHQNIMLWYSTNSDLFYKNYEKKINIEKNYLSLPYIDLHLVWYQAEKIALQRYAQGKIKAMGSIIFYPVPTIKKPIFHNNGQIKIIYFDIPSKYDPTRISFSSAERLLDTYNEIKEVLGLLSLRLNLSIDLTLKPKRKSYTLLSDHYSKLLLEDERNGIIKVVSPQNNLYNLIASNDIVIAYPWSSPAHIARELLIPALYFVSDPKSEWKLSKKRYGVPLIRDKIKLEQVLESCIKTILEQ